MLRPLLLSVLASFAVLAGCAPKTAKVPEPAPASELLASDEPGARLAVALYVYRIGRELGSLAAALGGLDALVFTGGIGENSAVIRERVCREAAWLGVDLDEAANQAGGPLISTVSSKTAAWVVPTNEELMIARHTRRVLG